MTRLVGVKFSMSLERIIRSTLAIPLFYGLSEDRMARLVGRADHVTYQPGDNLIENGEFGDAAVLVVSGHATQINALSSAPTYEAIESGALVGEMAMLVETQHHLTVTADTEVHAVKFSRDMIQDEMGADPALADHFVQRIAERLHSLAAEMRAYHTTTTGTASDDAPTLSDAHDHAPTDAAQKHTEPSPHLVN